MQESRTKNSLKNTAAGFANMVVGLALNFVKRTVFIQVLGVSFLGINGLFSNILAFLTLADLGLSTAMAYTYYKPIAENDTRKIAALNRYYRQVYNLIAAAILLIGVALIPFLKFLVKMENPVPDVYFYSAYVILLLETVVSYLFVYKGTLITADQKDHLVTRYRLLTTFACTAAQIAVLLVFRNFPLFLSMGLVFGLLNNLIVSHKANKLYPYLREKAEPLTKTEKNSIFGNIKSVFLYRISGVLINSTDNLLISSIVGTVFVGLYSNYLLIINSITSFVNICFRSLTASIGNVIVTQSKERRLELFRSMKVASFWFSTVLVSSIYVVLNEFMLAWLGPDFLLDGLTVFSIMFNFYLLCVLQPVWIFREASGLYVKTKYIMLVTAALNLVLSVVLGLWLGIAGILLASALAKLLTYIWYEPILLFHDFFGGSPAPFFRSLLLNCGCTALLVVGLRFLTSLIPLGSWAGFFVKGVLCFVLANLLYLLFYRKSEEFGYILSRLKRVLKR